MADITTPNLQQAVAMHLVDLGNGAYAPKVVAHGGGNHLLPGDVELVVAATVAAGANNQTLAGAVGKRTYITGFLVGGLGATSASIIAVTVTGLVGSATLTFRVSIPAGAGLLVSQLLVEFARPIPASADNTPIVVNVPSYGTGNLTADAWARGFQR